MAATGFRFAAMNITNDYVDMSLKMLASVSKNVNATGYLNKVVSPMTFAHESTSSPEGQSFMILAYAAYNDWDAAGKPGANGSSGDPLGDGNNDKKNSARSSATAATGLAAVAGALAFVLI